MQTLETQAKFARRHGVARQTVGKWRNRGLVVMVDNEHGQPRVDVEMSNANLETLQNPLKIERGIGGEDVADDEDAIGGENKPASTRAEPIDPLQGKAREARIAKETVEAARANLKYRQEAGALVPRVEVEGIGPVAAAMLQQAMARRRTNLAKVMLGCKTEREMIAALRTDDLDLLGVYAENLTEYDALASAAIIDGGS